MPRSLKIIDTVEVHPIPVVKMPQAQRRERVDRVAANYASLGNVSMFSFHVIPKTPHKYIITPRSHCFLLDALPDSLSLSATDATMLKETLQDGSVIRYRIFPRKEAVVNDPDHRVFSGISKLFSFYRDYDEKHRPILCVNTKHTHWLLPFQNNKFFSVWRNNIMEDRDPVVARHQLWKDAAGKEIWKPPPPPAYRSKLFLTDYFIHVQGLSRQEAEAKAIKTVEERRAFQQRRNAT
jgi:hypothetical protein